jgi:hypothetical protein
MSDVPALLARFRAWLPAMRPELEPDTAVDTVQTLLALKADRLDSPSPTRWSEQILRSLLLVEYPRRVVTAAEDRPLLVPQLTAFLEFLMAERLWDSTSLKPAAARRLLHDLEFEAMEAADDPGRRSMSGNIIHFGVSQGLDFSDPCDADLLFSWYNSLTHAERVEISETGNLRSAPSIPFPDGPLEPLWFLPPATGPLPGELSEAQWARKLEEGLDTLPFVAAVRAIARVLESGPVQLTATDALRLKECTAVLEEISDVYSIPSHLLPLRSMWEDHLLAAAWTSMWQSRAIKVEKHRARLKRGVRPEGDEWVKDALHDAVVEWALPQDLPAVSAETFTALTVMHQNGELVLPSMDQAGERFGTRAAQWPEPLEIQQLTVVYSELLHLHWKGLLEKEGESLWQAPVRFRCTTPVFVSAAAVAIGPVD